MLAVRTWLVLVSLIHVSVSSEAQRGENIAAKDRSSEAERAADDLWNELTEGDGKASDHDHWDRIVRRSVGWYDPTYVDDTLHIVNVQEYYRYVLEEEGWGEPIPNYVQILQNMRNEDASIQAEDDFVHVQKPIRGRFIVLLDSRATEKTLYRTVAVLQEAHAESEGRIRAEHITPLSGLGVGFMATMNSKSVALMSKHPFLEVIEEDIAVKRTMLPPRSNAHRMNERRFQREATEQWNLDRIDSRENKLNKQYNAEGEGENSDIYIIDTGVRYTHTEFEGRAKYAGFDAIDTLTGSNNKGADCQGHGTHCGATVAGKTYGVAKKAKIFSLRALGCEGSGAVSGIIQGMDFIAKQVKNGVHKGAVIFSMSLGVEASPSLNAAIMRVTERGIIAVSAAGNQAGDSCNYSPASARVGISVGATDKNDEMVAFSNAGECTDIYAPGVAIKSAISTCDTCTGVLSGTSMAAPHVAGYMAILMTLMPRLNAYQAKEHLVGQSTKGVVGLAAISSSLASRTPNRFLYVAQTTDEDVEEADILSYVRP